MRGSAYGLGDGGIIQSASVSGCWRVEILIMTTACIYPSSERGMVTIEEAPMYNSKHINGAPDSPIRIL
jgi:hypothetical protein